MNIYSTVSTGLKKIEEFTSEEPTTSGVYFKGKFIPAELLREIKAKY